MTIARMIGKRRGGGRGAVCWPVLVLMGVGTWASADGSDSAAAPIILTEDVRTHCLDILRAGIHSDSFWPSMHAAEALTLAGYGDEVRPHLERKLETEQDDRHRCGLARELVRAGDLSKVAVMLEILAKEDPYGHVHASESLFKCFRLGDGRLLRQAMARTDNPALRIMAAAALGRAGSPDAMALLRTKLADEDPGVHRIAGWVLGAIGDASDIPQLRRNLEKAADPVARAFAEHALAHLGDPEGRQALVRNLGDEDGSVRTYAANFAADARVVEAADHLIPLLDDPVPGVRIRAAQALLVLAQPQKTAPPADIIRDVYPATKRNPRYTEGSILQLNDGTLLYAVTEFIGGGSDASTAHIIARSSNDGGQTWTEPRVLQENVGKENVMSVTLRRLAPMVNGPAPIGMFFLVKDGPDRLHVRLRISEDEGRSFGEIIRVTDRPGYHVMNNDRVTVLSTGRLLAPIAATESLRENRFVSYCCLSDDGGKTWRYGRGRVELPKRGAMEPEVVELLDGRILMIMRNQLGTISAAWSEDGGDTWGAPDALAGIQAPEAPATLRTIPATGHLLLVWNNTYTPGAGHGGRRTPLTAALSRDGGQTWQTIRDLESDPDETYSYISLIFVQDRAILGYYVSDRKTGLHSSRFRSLRVTEFY